MKILVLDTDYPSPSNLYGDVFVHTRVKEYIRQGAEVQVVSFFREQPDYNYEGVSVKHAPLLKDVFNQFETFSPDIVYLHFYHRGLEEFIKKINIPVVIWVHGYEALGWYRRLFNYKPLDLLKSLRHLVRANFRQMVGFRKMVNYSNQNKRVHFIFVSEWMKSICETDAFFAKVKNYTVIPNPINASLFNYREKNEDARKKILLIRSFNSRKYANDIAVDALMALSGKPFFKELDIALYGKGKDFDSLTAPLKQFPNVKLNNVFLPNAEIPEVHKEYGVFLCPTRQDAQGVSMCEAMSSGLVPVTTDCTAIPEFVQNRHNGLLTNSANEVARSLELLYQQPALYRQLSHTASSSIREKCGIDQVVTQELNLINIFR
ncbi:MAG: glycosyltransferase family 4 protein [Pseudobacter sp.]|uniref:glycosyltransferase family 4 protein n=1 Tax=Pseudobacter sp. TaxID=2045420 RepID=UPI003F809992